MEERQVLGIQGLLAANVKTQEEQLAICTYSVDRYKNPLNKYLYLSELLVCCDINNIFYVRHNITHVLRLYNGWLRIYDVANVGYDYGVGSYCENKYFL